MFSSVPVRFSIDQWTESMAIIYDDTTTLSSVRVKAATLSAVAAFSLLMFRRPCCPIVASLRRLSWTDALLFLLPAIGFFMPITHRGAKYLWGF